MRIISAGLPMKSGVSKMSWPTLVISIALVERLAMRDVLSHIGQREFHEMEVEERLNKLDAAIEIYEDEFAKNGLNRLAIDF